MEDRPFGRLGTSSTLSASPLKRRTRAGLFDARRAARQRTILPGKLYLGPGQIALDCLIGDISPRGARVRLKPGMTIQKELHLVHLREWTVYKARVVWHRGDGNVGLVFTRSHDLDGACAPELRVMREFCVQSEDKN